MKYLLSLFAGTLLVLGASTLRADDEIVETYTANLSERDHQASDGYKLTEAADVLRQDRANFHKFHKRDKDDGDDEFFADEDNRARIPELLRKGQNTPEILNMIKRGGAVMVRVSLMKGRTGMYLVVDAGD